MSVRYKVRAPSERLYHELLNLLAASVPVFVASEKRRVLSTGEIPNKILNNIKEMGATVTRDFQYDPEVRTAAAGKVRGT